MEGKGVEIVGKDDDGNMEANMAKVEIVDEVVEEAKEKSKKKKEAKGTPDNILKRSVGMLDYMLEKVQDMFEEDEEMAADPDTLLKALGAVNKVQTDMIKNMIAMDIAFGRDNANNMFKSIGLPTLNTNGSVAVPRLANSPQDVNIESGKNSSFGGITKKKKAPGEDL
jgi:hypothetical protein